MSWKECKDCKSRRSIPGDCHVRCNDPDPEMTGNKAGIQGGWFNYPHNFDPTWMAKVCSNREAND